MKLHKLLSYCFLMLFSLLTCPALAQSGQMTVHLDKPGHAISPILYGLMTEEINHSYDGGLYGELIQNRVFKADSAVPVHWSLVQGGGGQGAMTLDKTDPLSSALGMSLRLDITSGGQRVGVANDGYWGIPVKPNTRYRASFYAKAETYAGPLTVDIESADGAIVYASAAVPKIAGAWRQYTATLATRNIAPTEAARFVISASSPGTVRLNLVSLFPPTFNNRPNGNRIDLMQKMAAMKPAFLRMPGGNYVEGYTLTERFKWKEMLGSLIQRSGHQGPWGYRSSDGLGLLEFLEWCEDLHMQPVLAIFAGYALDSKHVAAGPELQPFVQDALDEIEYVTGGPKTKWGAVRVQDGHPAPFPLTYVEVGNEDGFDKSGSYESRYAQFYDAIKKKYPRLQVIATTPVTSRRADMVDDHYYRSAADMELDSGHYDSASRTGPKIFVGEWASIEGKPTPTLNAALGDAAWLTGLERNSDLVLLSCYAPMLVNVNPGASQWGTNLIGYDALSSFGSPSYYAQAMFAGNPGNVVLPIEVTQPAGVMPALPPSHGGIGVATWATQAEFKNVKVTHGNQTLYQKDFAQGDADWKASNGIWQAVDGVLRQTSESQGSLATAGSPDWTDYTYSLKARKISGAEGFLIMFHALNADNYVWWNIGGWGNTRTQMEIARNGGKQILGPPASNTVETGRWYDIKIEAAGGHIRCYLDGALITEADENVNPVMPLYTEASQDNATGDVILKVVNVAPVPVSMQINLLGTQFISQTGFCQVLTGEPPDVNTLAEPTKIVPQTVALTDAGPRFVHQFPANSVNVLRLHVR
ncbi:MAG: alpha-L-arabinofuranosidase C-terminal domain-containing protein [Janthinobacterium lividum]